MTITYRITLADDTGSRNSIGLAESANGTARNQVQRFDGAADLAFIDVPDADCAAYLEQLMDADANVLGYQELA